ncbi:hypothetical protein Bpfe_012199 [Biomphalaria pfeifferi]|uniref:Uncharacterized protein n=1 Tax=Biomphalaria pfeifferi TaxID=112525 RepID=A0AAD8BPP4_BIOPF|nr:hypothetical protein Bpfe_012199 [Biomphalaria pfeifferi]
MERGVMGDRDEKRERERNWERVDTDSETEDKKQNKREKRGSGGEKDSKMEWARKVEKERARKTEIKG